MLEPIGTAISAFWFNRAVAVEEVVLLLNVGTRHRHEICRTANREVTSSELVGNLYQEALEDEENCWHVRGNELAEV